MSRHFLEKKLGNYFFLSLVGNEKKIESRYDGDEKF